MGVPRPRQAPAIPGIVMQVPQAAALHCQNDPEAKADNCRALDQKIHEVKGQVMAEVAHADLEVWQSCLLPEDHKPASIQCAEEQCQSPGKRQEEAVVQCAHVLPPRQVEQPQHGAKAVGEHKDKLALLQEHAVQGADQLTSTVEGEKVRRRPKEKLRTLLQMAAT